MIKSAFLAHLGLQNSSLLMNEPLCYTFHRRLSFRLNNCALAESHSFRCSPVLNTVTITYYKIRDISAYVLQWNAISPSLTLHPDSGFSCILICSYLSRFYLQQRACSSCFLCSLIKPKLYELVWDFMLGFSLRHVICHWAKGTSNYSILQLCQSQ